MDFKMNNMEVLDGSMTWKVLSEFFLTKVEFILDNSVYRSGILQNYKTVSDQYRVKFKGDVRVMILPTPFEILKRDDLVLFDFRPKILFHGDEKLINTLEKVKKNDASPFFNKVVRLRAVR
jgi:hypothetical protein